MQGPKRSNKFTERCIVAALLLPLPATVFAGANPHSSWQIMAEKAQQLLEPTEAQIDNKLIQTYQGYRRRVDYERRKRGAQESLP
jgi:hypothetical protein